MPTNGRSTLAVFADSFKSDMQVKKIQKEWTRGDRYVTTHSLKNLMFLSPACDVEPIWFCGIMRVSRIPCRSPAYGNLNWYSGYFIAIYTRLFLCADCCGVLSNCLVQQNPAAVAGFYAAPASTRLPGNSDVRSGAFQALKRYL